jgi:hypothetical protein
VKIHTRDRLGALIGAGLLTIALGSTVFAVTPLAAPTYIISVQKTATPNIVGPGGADVLFTVTVHNGGTGSFAIVNVTDGLVGCTISAHLELTTTLTAGNDWTFTCLVTGVLPNTTNTATVYACHNNGGCTNGSHDTTGTASVTVALDSEATLPPPSASPDVTAGPTASPDVTAGPTASPEVTAVPGASTGPTASPNGGGGGATDQPTMPPTNAGLDGGSGPADGAWLMVVVLGILLASMIVLTPAKARRRS